MLHKNEIKAGIRLGQRQTPTPTAVGLNKGMCGEQDDLILGLLRVFIVRSQERGRATGKKREDNRCLSNVHKKLFVSGTNKTKWASNSDKATQKPRRLFVDIWF